MKTNSFSYWLMTLVFVLVATGCSSSRNTTSSRSPSSTRLPEGQYPAGVPIPGTSSSTKRLPPGQAKKIDGQQSAKAYAPGQQKKAQVTESIPKGKKAKKARKVKKK